MKLEERIKHWADRYSEVERWLAKIERKRQNAFDLMRFCEWAGKEPHELLALKKSPTRKDAERLLDDFVADQETGFTNSVKFRVVSAVKSFFKHNLRDLARASGAMTLEKVNPYNKPLKEDLRKLWSWALNLRDKALISFVCSTAIAKGTLCQLKWKHLEENWAGIVLPCINIPGGLLKGHGRGRYKGVRQITFLTPEAKQDLLNYKEWIEAKLERNLTSEDPIFLETYAPYKPIKYSRLGTLVWKLSRVTGVPFSWHDAKRYVNTALEEIRMPPNWARKIQGRKVHGEAAPYSLSAVKQLREKFSEVVSLLEFTREKVSIFSVEETERLRKMAEIMGALKTKELRGEKAPSVTDEELKQMVRNLFGRLFQEERKSKEKEDCSR